MIPARSLVSEAQARAKSLPLAGSFAAAKQAARQDDERLERKLEVIAIWERCRDQHGISMHEFIRRWDHKYSTGHGYLDRDEKRYPKARSVRIARAIEECLDAESKLRSQIAAAKGLEVSSW